jgi:hypothetical protein
MGSPLHGLDRPREADDSKYSHTRGPRDKDNAEASAWARRNAGSAKCGRGDFLCVREY